MSKETNNPQPVLRPVVQSLYPTMGTLQEVMEFAESKLPIISKNELTTLLMTYHNTLLNVHTRQYQGKD